MTRRCSAARELWGESTTVLEFPCCKMELRRSATEWAQSAMRRDYLSDCKEPHVPDTDNHRHAGQRCGVGRCARPPRPLQFSHVGLRPLTALVSKERPVAAQAFLHFEAFLPG